MADQLSVVRVSESEGLNPDIANVQEYIYLNTYYDIGAARKIIMLFNNEDIDFRTVDKFL